MIQPNKMPPPPTHQACQTPNPPWWCDEVPNMTITQNLWILVVLGLIIGIVYLTTKYKDEE